MFVNVSGTYIRKTGLSYATVSIFKSEWMLYHISRQHIDMLSPYQAHGWLTTLIHPTTFYSSGLDSASGSAPLQHARQHSQLT